MTRSITSLAACLVVTVLLISPAIGDTVYTTDGSTITGKIEVLTAGKLTVTTDFAGSLEIDTAKVSAISTDGSVSVVLASGDRLVGTVKKGAGSEDTVIQTAVGEVPIVPSKLTSLWPEGAEDPAVTAIRDEAAKAVKAATPVWSAVLEAGGVMKEGNTETLDGRGRFDIKRKTNKDLLEFFVAADYSETDDTRTRNEYRGGIRYENSPSDIAYWYARLGMEYDEFENLDLRTTAAAGVGRYWIKKPEHELKTSLGFGYRHESYNNGVSVDAAVVDLGLNYRIDLAPTLQFTHDVIYSPDIQDTADYRLDVDTAIVLPFENKDLKLKLGMRNEYNSRPQTGNERLDNTYYANIVWRLN